MYGPCGFRPACLQYDEFGGGISSTARHDAQLDLLTAQRFLEVAAKADAAGNYQHQLFIGLFSDLVQIPALRRTLLTLAKAHQHNPAMKDALAALFKQAG